ncbi:reverse transcriptase domain-containing protein [Tanacetum coccineum]
MGLWYLKDSGFELTAFSDADHAGCLDTRKSTSVGIQFLADKLVSWMSKKQNCTAMSSAEAEYDVICKLCSSNVDEDTASRLWLQLQQNTVVLRLSVSHSNIMQPRTAFANKAHPYSVAFDLLRDALSAIFGLSELKILADFIVERPEEESPDTLMGEEEELPEPWILFTDGSSCTDGSRAGLILTNSEGMEFTYALRFRFDATNNEAEYEALIAGLRIAEQMGVKNLQANVDSCNFKAFSIKQVPRSENKKADALSKIASTSFAYLSKQVLVEELKEKSISTVEVLAVVEKEGDTWMTPIFKYLMDRTLLAEGEKQRVQLKRKSSWQRVILYNKWDTLQKIFLRNHAAMRVGPLQEGPIYCSMRDNMMGSWMRTEGEMRIKGMPCGDSDFTGPFFGGPRKESIIPHSMSYDYFTKVDSDKMLMDGLRDAIGGFTCGWGGFSEKGVVVNHWFFLDFKAGTLIDEISNAVTLVSEVLQRNL